MLPDTMWHKHIEVSPNYKTEWCKHGPIIITPVSMQLAKTN